MLLALFLTLAEPQARPCTADDIAELTRPDTSPYVLSCQASLGANHSITRPIVIEGRQASGTILDCHNATIGTPDVAVTASNPTIAIRSTKDADSHWSAPTNIIIRNCNIFGAIRIWGMGADGSYDDLRASSRLPNHTQNAQDAAPSHIRLDNLRLVANGTIPVYVGPGATYVTLDRSMLTGRSAATAIYLDAESAHNAITNNYILVRGSREAIAIDGSAHNLVKSNRIDMNGKPGILLYRNCGERGVVRHQTPSHNLIADNVFTGGPLFNRRLVVENARNGGRSYCRDDAGYPFGSSVDDRDGGTDNAISNNRHRKWQ